MTASRRSFFSSHFVGVASIILVFLCGFLVWRFAEPVLDTVAVLWAVNDVVEAPADAIVILGGQYDPRSRTNAAADLYHKGFAPKILISNPALAEAAELALNPSDADVNMKILRQLDVPPSAISTFGNSSRTTYDEARALLDWGRMSVQRGLFCRSSGNSAGGHDGSFNAN